MLLQIPYKRIQDVMNKSENVKIKSIFLKKVQFDSLNMYNKVSGNVHTAFNLSQRFIASQFE